MRLRVLKASRREVTSRKYKGPTQFPGLRIGMQASTGDGTQDTPGDQLSTRHKTTRPVGQIAMCNICSIATPQRKAADQVDHDDN